MCDIYTTRLNPKSKRVYILFENPDHFGVRRLSLEQFNFAKKFHNNDFLVEVAHPTDDRDINDSYYSEEFIDPDITYSEYFM